MGIYTRKGYKITDEYKKALIEQRENIKKTKENEQKKLDNIRTMMEEAIVRTFSGDELIKAQLYKEAIFGYLKFNTKDNLSNNDMDTLVTILYKILTEGRASTSEYCILNELSKINNNITTNELLNKYSESYFILMNVAKKIGMHHHQLIDKIEYADNVSFEELKTTLTPLFNRIDLTFEMSSSEVINAIDTIRKLRLNPSLMGLTYDKMSIYLDKSLVLKRKSSVN